MKLILYFFVTLISSFVCFAQISSPKILLINAHPDDESGCAATVFKVTKELKGVADLAVITNGEAGFKYSTLAESIYGVELTEEKIGREFLPTIRKKELMAGGAWVGIRNYFFFDQLDTKYTLDADTVLRLVWDTTHIVKRLTNLIEKEKYNYVFCLLPTKETHGHHKAATILALEVISRLPLNKRPVILGVSGGRVTDTLTNTFLGLSEYPKTKIDKDSPIFTFDRTTKFGFKDNLNYKIVVNWLIAEHKSQGTMQTYMGQGDIEKFHFFSINPKEKINQIQEFFNSLKTPIYKKKNY